MDHVRDVDHRPGGGFHVYGSSATFLGTYAMLGDAALSISKHRSEQDHAHASSLPFIGHVTLVYTTTDWRCPPVVQVVV